MKHESGEAGSVGPSSRLGWGATTGTGFEGWSVDDGGVAKRGGSREPADRALDGLALAEVRVTSRRQRMRAWIALGALVGGLACAEIAVRVFARERWDSDAIRAALNPTYLHEMMRWSTDVDRYYELRPNHELMFKGRMVRIGADGFLAENSEPPRGAMRVALVGGSSTFEFGVPGDRVWGALFCRELEALVGRDVWMKNYSVPTYVSTQQASVILREVVDWGPDLLIWHYDHRDAYPVILDAGPVQLAPEIGDNVLHSAAWKVFVRTRREREIERLRFKGEDTGLFENYIVDGPWYERHIDAIRRVDAKARQLGLPVLFVVYDSFLHPGDGGREHFTHLHEPLLARIRTTNFLCVDLFEPLRDWMEKRGDSDQSALWLSIEPRDGHPNELGHEVVANAVTNAIAAERAWLDALARRADERIQKMK